jgi:hypothetical protein
MSSGGQTKTELLAALRAHIQIFVDSAEAIPPDALLRVVTEWSPRDVIAHLIGWNVYTLQGCRDLEQGIAPAYLSDEADDFKNVNAASVQRYVSSDKDELLSQLRVSAQELLDYLEQLPAGSWNHNYSVYGPSGRPSLISQHIEALAADYLGHAQEITAWTRHSPSA